MTAEATSAGEITEEAHLEAEKRIGKFSYRKPEAFDPAGARNFGRTDSARRNPRLTDIANSSISRPRSNRGGQRSPNNQVFGVGWKQ